MKLKYLINLLLFCILCLTSGVAFGQTDATASSTNETTMNKVSSAEKKAVPTTNILHQNGRINLVVFVLATIFAGIILYLIRIERTLRKVEKNNS